MEKYYTTPSVPASFSGVNKISRHSKKAVEGVRKTLNQNETYSLHKPVRRRFDRSAVVVGGINNQFDGDLFDVTKYKKWNNGYSYMLIVIDVFSRFLMLVSLKTKKGMEVKDALQKILDKNKCINYRSDSGGEFVNSHVSKLLKDRSIKHFIARNTETKASYSERVIRTLSKNTFKWIDVIQDMVSSYNKTYHRTIKMAPADVNTKNQGELWKRLYLGNARAPIHYKLDVGSVVRMSVLKSGFKKERDENWTRELFIITTRYRRSGIPLYKLKDWDGDAIVGSFYEAELQSVIVDESTEYKIDKILGKRIKNGQKQVLVSWRGWGKKYNSYIEAKLIK